MYMKEQHTSLDRDDLAAMNNRIVQDFVPPTGEEAWNWRLYMTSGTTSHPILAVAKHRYGAGSTQWFFSSPRSVVCIGTMGMQLFTTKTIRRDAVESNSVLTVNAKDLVPELARIITDFKPDRLVGFPSFVLQVAEYVNGETARGIKDLHMVGEIIRSDVARALLQHFPYATIRSIYGTVEFGQISKPGCPHLALNWYHPRTGVTVEIIDPDKYGVGDIVISGKKNEEVPVDRYRVGDVGHLSKRRCPCGDEVSFEVLGRRGHDYIRLAGALLRQEEFDRVAVILKSFDDYRAEAFAVFESGKMRGKIVLHIYSHAGVGTEALGREVADRFSRELFVTSTRTLAELVASGDFFPLEIVWESKPFTARHKDTKLVQVNG